MKDYINFLSAMPTGLAVCDRSGKVLFRNRKLSDILGSDDETILSAFLAEIIGENGRNATKERSGASREYRENGRALTVRLHESGKLFYLYVSEKDASAGLLDEIRKVDELTCELKELFRTCTNDTIWITDAEGNTIVAGKKNAEHLGVAIEELEGKNVRDLERNQVFFPSVTAKVLETGKREVLLQKTCTGRHCVAIGIPYFTKNGELFRVVSIARDISQQYRVGSLLASADTVRSTDQSNSYLRKFITANEQMLSILNLIKIVAAMDSTVLIEGETGSGKGVAASLIHQLSRRAGNVLLQINCGAISPELINSELFGYTPGTFTGALKSGKKGLIEAANGGTLFLDEIGELPPDQQMKLLEVLQDKTIMRIGGRKKIPVDVRIIAATNRHLEDLVKQGTFRQDLFYRLNVVPFFIPPLRRRKEDIPLLVKHFSWRMAEKRGSRKEFSHEAMDALHKYDWPGNVRELEHLVEKLYVTLRKKVIEERDILEILPWAGKQDSPETNAHVHVKKLLPLRSGTDAVERKLLQLAAGCCVTEEEIARILGSSQSNISRKMKRHGVKIVKGGAVHDQNA